MGNKCNCIASQSTDEAEDALLGSEQRGISRNDRPEQRRQRRFLLRPSRQVTRETPRGPPPPYQQVQLPLCVIRAFSTILHIIILLLRNCLHAFRCVHVFVGVYNMYNYNHYMR